MSAFGDILQSYMRLGGFKSVAALVRWCGRPGAPYISRLQWGKQKNASWDLIFRMAIPLARAIRSAGKYRGLTVIELASKITNDLMGSLHDTSASPSLENLAQGILQGFERHRRKLAADKRKRDQQAKETVLSDETERQAMVDNKLFRDAGLL